MKKSWIIVGLVLIMITFCLFILSLLQLFPRLLGGLLLLSAVVFTLHAINNQNRFKGLS
ncbi:hypothetical protein [Bacillus taeanensis]|uniref:hypothetical protein n=1 Tax=Bacillus taeanensis TaxID=273032 RepID=UPI0015F01180|nr:hypothetical protein [Bacillus taeanensis]